MGLPSKEILIHGTMEKPQRLSEHSDVCDQLSERKCCIQCSRDRINIRAERFRMKRKNEANSIRKTRSTPHRTKYASILCINCTDKIAKDYCEMCKSKYSNTRRQTSRDSIKKRKLEEVHTNSEITEENVTKKLKYVHNQLVHPIGSVSALRKEENNCKQSNHKTDENSKKRSLVQNDSVNTQLNKNYNLLPKTKYSSVLCINCKYKAPKDICEICIPEYKRAKDRASRENIRNRKENIKKNEICSNISDLDNISPIKNKLSEKTIRNKSAKIKDIAKSSTAEILSHVIKKSDRKERLKLTKSLLPDYEDEIKAKMCKRVQKEVGAKSDLSYKLKSQCLNESKNTNETALMKLFGSGRT